MSKGKEQTMMRFFLFVGVVWVLSKLAKLLFASMSRPSEKKEQQRKYCVGGQTAQPPPVEFKDVQDAQFEDVTDKEKIPK